MKQKYLIHFSLCGLIICCDQLAKYYVITYLPLDISKSIIPGLLSFSHSHNVGLAFGLLKEAPLFVKQVFFIGIPIFALILIVLIFIKLQDGQMVTSVALTSILAGAVGNLFDRIQFGYVIDFINLQLGEVFRVTPHNIADISIVTGVCIMFINTLKFEGSTRTSS